jgi:hypothetical protein
LKIVTLSAVSFLSRSISSQKTRRDETKKDAASIVAIRRVGAFFEVVVIDYVAKTTMIIRKTKIESSPDASERPFFCYNPERSRGA